MLKLSIVSKSRFQLFKLSTQKDITATFTSGGQEIALESFVELVLLNLDKIIPSKRMLQSFSGANTNVPLLENIRGRATEIQSTGKHKSEEELLYIEGSFFLEGDEEKLTEASFEYRVNTEFDSFKSSDIILHKVKEQIKGVDRQISEFMHPENPFSKSGAEITCFRLGLEIYDARATGSLGIAPAIKNRVYLCADKRRIELTLHLSKTKNTITREVIYCISRALKDTSLYKTFENEMSECFEA